MLFLKWEKSDNPYKIRVSGIFFIKIPAGKHQNILQLQDVIYFYILHIKLLFLYYFSKIFDKVNSNVVNY